MGDEAGDVVTMAPPPEGPPTSTVLPVTEIPGGLVHPVVGYLVCIAVLATFGAAIAFICFRHYRRKNTGMIKLPIDDEENGVLSFQNDKPKTKPEEEVKTVILKRNGQQDSKKNKDSTSEEVTPMLSDPESLSESMDKELSKFGKKPEDLPDNTPKPVATEVTPISTPATEPIATSSPDSKVSEVESSPPPSPRSDRQILTESQVLEILDDAPEDDSPAAAQDSHVVTPETKLDIEADKPPTKAEDSDSSSSSTPGEESPATPANTPQESDANEPSPVEITADVHNLPPPPPLPSSPIPSTADREIPRPMSLFPPPPPPPPPETDDTPDAPQDSAIDTEAPKGDSTTEDVSSKSDKPPGQEEVSTNETSQDVNTNNSNSLGDSSKINVSCISRDTYL